MLPINPRPFVLQEFVRLERPEVTGSIASRAATGFSRKLDHSRALDSESAPYSTCSGIGHGKSTFVGLEAKHSTLPS